MSSIKIRPDRQRLPITITLDRSTYSFIEECARQKHFRSLDDFFEAALAIYRNHVHALNAYVELEEAKGDSMEEIMRNAQCEIVFTRCRDS